MAIHARTVEELGKRLYESTDEVGVPWVRRDLTVREGWLKLARQQMQRDIEATRALFAAPRQHSRTRREHDRE